MKRQYDFSKARRGPVVRVPRGKTRITIRVDEDLLQWFRGKVDEAGGGNYQTLINNALRTFVGSHEPSLSTVVRRIVRDEIRKARGPHSRGRKAA